ncbi:MAG: MBL fold metallo-hydrolase, partial [Candidatus Brocadiae bacterium]|nr:MBL fold metallo-hydrolase [Candidatus Brocadiia bacterium]
MLVLNNLYQLSGYDFGTVSSMFAVKGKNSLAIVEAGGKEDLEIAAKTMDYWGLSKYPITHVFITHSHFDHIENALVFREMGAKIVAVAGDADSVEAGD